MILLVDVDKSYEPLEDWASIYVLKMYAWFKIANLAARLTRDMERIKGRVADALGVTMTFVSIAISLDGV